MGLNFKKHIIFFFTIFILLFLISACGNNEGSGEKATENDKEKSVVKIDSEMGEVSLPTNAKNIMAPFHEDTLLALGVTPVAKWAIGQTVQTYLETDLKDVPSIEWNLPLEQVLNHNPDLIILENNLESYEGTYEDYNKVAPTYVMTEETTKDWRKQLEVFGKILGKEDKAEEVLQNYEEKVSNAKQELDNAIGDQTVAVIWVVGNQFFLFEENRHSAEVLYSELGVNAPTLVKELGKAGVQWNPLSIEKLSELDADHVFLLALEGEQGLETLQNSSVWQSTPAVKNGNVHQLKDASNWTNKGLLASQKTIEDVLQTLVK